MYRENDFDEMDFLDDESDLKFIDINDDEDDFRVNLDDDIFEDSSDDEDSSESEDFSERDITYYEDEEPSGKNKKSKKNKKKSPNRTVNRIMAGMGVVILGFTVFYGFVAWGFLHKDKDTATDDTNNEKKVVVQEDGKFISPYSDENISEDVKTLLNGVTLNPTSTNFTELDDRAKKILENTVDTSKSNYENLRNIYDYLMYNFKILETTYVDDDAVYNTVNNVNYVATLDMKIIYRANRALESNQGSADDFACSFAVLARQLGYDAYYIDGAILNDAGLSQSHGYAVVIIDGTKYIFDAEYDSKLLNTDSENETENTEETTVLVYEETTGVTSTNIVTEEGTTVPEMPESGVQAKVLKNTVPQYFAFCKTFAEVESVYTKADVEKSLENFGKFETLGEFSFDVSITSSGGNAYGSVKYVPGYSEEGNSTAADGDITVDIGTTIRLKGVVTGSNKNTWKLVIKQFDEDMDEIREVTVYNDTDNLTENTLSITPSRAGYSRIIYMVTDENGRTCTVTKQVRVLGDEPEEYTTKAKYEPESTTRYYETETTERETQEPETTERETEEPVTTEPETEEPSEEPTTEPVEEPSEPVAEPDTEPVSE